MKQQLHGLGLAAFLIVLSGLQPALAAERVLLKYRGFSRTVAVDDLTTLSESGETSDSLSSLLNAAGQPPEELRTLLNNSVPASPVLLDKALNSWPGEWMLDQLGEAIHSPSGGASRQALRSAIVLSATDDNQVTVLEILENYPTPEVVLEGDRIHSAYNRFAEFLAPLSIFL